MHRVLLLVVLSAAGALGQGNPFFGRIPYPQLRAYLQLTDSQMNSLTAANHRYVQWLVEKQSRISQVQLEIHEETARSPLDPMALGVRYAEIETICRQMRDRRAELQKTNLEILTEAQKTRLKALEDALRLMPLISEAQSAQLLSGPPVAYDLFPVAIVGAIPDRFNRTDGVRFGGDVCSSTVLVPGRNVLTAASPE